MAFGCFCREGSVGLLINTCQSVEVGCPCGEPVRAGPAVLVDWASAPWLVSRGSCGAEYLRSSQPQVTSS